jgi:hypothetical protein
MLSTAGDISGSYTPDNWQLPAGGLPHLRELWITAEPWPAVQLSNPAASQTTSSSSSGGDQPGIYLPVPPNHSSSSTAESCIPFAPSVPLPDWMLPWLTPALRHLTIGASQADVKDLRSWRSNALVPQQQLWQLQLQVQQMDDMTQLLLEVLPQDNVQANQQAMQLVQQLQDLQLEIEKLQLYQQALDAEPQSQKVQQVLQQQIQGFWLVLDLQQQQIDADQQSMYHSQLMQRHEQQQAPEELLQHLTSMESRYQEYQNIVKQIQQLQQQQDQQQARLQQQQYNQHHPAHQQQQGHRYNRYNALHQSSKLGRYEQHSQGAHWPFSSWREDPREVRSQPFSRLGPDSGTASGPSGLLSGPAWRMDLYQPDGLSGLCGLDLLKSLRVSPLTEMPAAARELHQLVQKQQQGECPTCSRRRRSSSSSYIHKSGSWASSSSATDHLLPSCLSGLKGLEVLELDHTTELPMQLPEQWGDLPRLQLLSITHAAACRPQVWPPSFASSDAGVDRQLNQDEQQQLETGCGLSPALYHGQQQQQQFCSSSSSTCSVSNLLMCQYAHTRFTCSCTTPTAAALSGTLPTEWQRLTSLRALNLPGHNLTGHLPKDYAAGAALSSGSGNDGMWQLQYLVLRRNRLTGSVPSLYVWNPDLEAEDTQAIVFSSTGFPLLEVLDLDCNILDGILPQLTGLPQLRVMSAASNRLAGNVPAAVPATLEVLDLQHNDLSGPVPCFATGSSSSSSSNSGNYFGGSSSNDGSYDKEDDSGEAGTASVYDGGRDAAGAPAAAWHSSSNAWREDRYSSYSGSSGSSSGSSGEDEQQLSLQLVNLADNR